MEVKQVKRTIYCRTTGEVQSARQKYDRDDVKLTVVLVCSECNVIPYEDAKKVAIHGRIHCWNCYAEFLNGILGRDASEEELQASIVESRDTYGLYCYKGTSDCVPCP